METLVVVSQHRNQTHSRSKGQISHHFCSPPSRAIKGFSCRNFQSGVGILPSPPPVFSYFTGSPVLKTLGLGSEPSKLNKRSSPIGIRPKQAATKISTYSEDQSCSELWAGPTYSNSPPPSSLPIPKFSLCSKHNISIESPDQKSGSIRQAEEKSVPSLSTGDSFVLSREFLLDNTPATENLWRILNLDLAN